MQFNGVKLKSYLQPLEELTIYLSQILGVLSGIKKTDTKVDEENRNTALYETVGDNLAFLIQIFGLVTLTYIGYKQENTFMSWILSIALFMVSLRWWENYVSSDSAIGRSIH